MRDAIERAARVVGSQSELARMIGVKRAAVSWWKRYGIPAEHVLKIERATNGQVSRHDLRPDLYPRDEVAA